MGWAKEEFDALGVPFEGRAARTAEYVRALRALWRYDVASFQGEYVAFEDVRVNPKPRNRTLPVVLGGNSDAALRHAAAWADGWYGFSLPDVEDAALAASTLRRLARAAGREPGDLRLAVSLRAPMPGTPAGWPMPGSTNWCWCPARRATPSRPRRGSASWPGSGSACSTDIGASSAGIRGTATR